MGFLKILSTACFVFFVTYSIMLAGFHIFPRPEFISQAGMVAVFVFLIFEIAFVTFK
ncbi:MAG: hypothetical protein V1676_01825 [Candidatus Diapherotrites archaeon]